MPPVSASLWGCRYPCMHDQQGSDDSHPTSFVRGADDISCSALTLRPAAQSEPCKPLFPPEERESVSYTQKQRISVLMSVIIKYANTLSCTATCDKLLPVTQVFGQPIFFLSYQSGATQ